MAQLTPAFFATILKIEGGYQNRADDTGNYACGALVGTKYGVSAGAYQTWSGHCPTQAEMQGITEQTAFNFYAWYFDRYNLYQIENQQFFELLANNTMGSPAAAARAEQRALNELGFPVAVDGNRGPQTIQALNDAWRRDAAAIYNAVRQQWIDYLYSINKPQFIDGWLTRLNRYFPPITPSQVATGQVAAGSGVILIVIAAAAWFIFKNKRA
jgi:lysozyme family protein